MRRAGCEKNSERFVPLTHGRKSPIDDHTEEVFRFAGCTFVVWLAIALGMAAAAPGDEELRTRIERPDLFRRKACDKLARLGASLQPPALENVKFERLG